MEISIIGATGYVGQELMSILSRHRDVSVKYITSETQAGNSIDTVYPHLTKFYSYKLVDLAELPRISRESDIVFICLPHGHAIEAARTIVENGARVIDLGADYRFRDSAVYEQWYKVKHTNKAEAVYGLTELYRDQIRTARIVGNPGCFTTASILALAPLVKNGLIRTESIIVDAKSGVSGSGRGPTLNTHFSEGFENVKAYNVASHRHTPEIEQALTEFAGRQVMVSFTPHIIPMTRGILSTCYANLKAGTTKQVVDQAFYNIYESEYFIRLFVAGGYPATKYTRGSNFCDIGWHIDERTGRVVVIAAIDNLVKGAAGQAIQNMNVMLGLEETTGLQQVPLYP